MKKPYEIHSDFFKKMIASVWYENREIILDSLPHHLEELPDNVKKFLREIWYLTISYDAYYRSNGCIFLSTVLHNFGEVTSWSNTASPTDWCLATNKTVTTPTAKCSKAATQGERIGQIFYWDHENEWDEEDYFDEFGVQMPEEVKFQNIYLIGKNLYDCFSRMIPV